MFMYILHIYKKPIILSLFKIDTLNFTMYFNDFDMLFKGGLSGLRQFLAAESPLKMMKNAFYFTSKALFVLKIFKFLS